MIEFEIKEDYRICEMCHCLFPEDNFEDKPLNNPRIIPIQKCPYCQDKDHFVKVKVQLQTDSRKKGEE